MRCRGWSVRSSGHPDGLVSADLPGPVPGASQALIDVQIANIPQRRCRYHEELAGEEYRTWRS